MNALSPAGTLFIARFEGFRAACYDDGGAPGRGNCTIGYGHLVHMGPTTPADSERWGELSTSEALVLLHRDAQFAWRAVYGLGVALTQAQVDALVSFAFNCGAGALTPGKVVPVAVCSKPHRWNLIAMRAWRKRVGAALGLYSHVNGVVLAGLLRRRQAEATLFASGAYTRPRNPYA